MKNEFHFCPNCGSGDIRNINMRKWQCAICGFVLYNNSAASIALIIQDKFGKFLFEVRAKEPCKGLLALPGGFVEHDETLEQACIRECFEEIGVKPTSLKYLVSFTNTYEYKDVLYKTCDAFFIASLADNASFDLQKSEVAEIKHCFVRNHEELSNLPLAFDSTRKALEFYINNK